MNKTIRDDIKEIYRVDNMNMKSIQNKLLAHGIFSIVTNNVISIEARDGKIANHVTNAGVIIVYEDNSYAVTDIYTLNLIYFINGQ